MPRRPRVEYPGAIHHITQRGNNREKIFSGETDYNAYLGMLGQIVDRQHWQVVSYCLMPTTTHLLIRTPAPNLTEGMRFLGTAYAHEFNRARGATGHVFGGRFRSSLVETDEHLITTLRYMALHPVASALCACPAAWEWSAHAQLLGRARRVSFLAPDVLGADPPLAEERYRALFPEVTDAQDQPSGGGSPRRGFHASAARPGDASARRAQYTMITPPPNS
jgi:putative transposase